MKKISITNQVFIAMLLGTIIGLLFNQYGMNNFFTKNILLDGVFYIIGNIFLNAIKMLVVPLVFVSITLGVAQIGDTTKIGKLGGRTILFYLSTTVFAILIGLITANIINPGLNLDLNSLGMQATEKISNETTITEAIIQMIPTNIFQSFYEGNMIQIIIFSIFFGISISLLGNKVFKLHIIFDEINNVFLKMMEILMKLAPIAVFSLIITTFANLGLDVFMPLLSYLLTILIALILHVVIIYFFVIHFILRLNPLKFITNIKSALSFAFTTSSSAATLPLTKKCVEDNCGVDTKISSFVLPIGATINMDGTAIMQGIAVVFLAQALNVDLTMFDYIIVIVTATLASIGTAAVPGGGLVLLSMVMIQVGLPIESIGVLLGVDRLVGMSITVINVCGDCVCSLFVSSKENLLNKEKYNSKNEV